MLAGVTVHWTVQGGHLTDNCLCCVKGYTDDRLLYSTSNVHLWSIWHCCRVGVCDHRKTDPLNKCHDWTLAYFISRFSACTLKLLVGHQQSPICKRLFLWRPFWPVKLKQRESFKSDSGMEEVDLVVLVWLICRWSTQEDTFAECKRPCVATV